MVAFMPWKGYNYEDAIVISERIVREDLFTSIHIEEFTLEVRDTKRGLEELTNDIPNVSAEATKDLDENGIIRVGAEVKEGDILVYNYNGEGLLVHRLLKVKEELVCKGDNAFRFEMIGYEDVIGKVVSINGHTIEKWEKWKIQLSYEIGSFFSKWKNSKTVMNTSLYKLYSLLVLKNESSANVFCLARTKPIYTENNKNERLPNCNVEDYSNVDRMIISCADRRMSLVSFVEKVVINSKNKYLDHDVVYFRLFELINNQTILIE